MIALAQQSNGTEFKSTAELLMEEVSASRLKRWSTCRLQFFYHYVAQIKKPSTPALVVGKVVHSVLQEFNRARWKGDYTFKEKLNYVFAAKWTEEQVGDQKVEWDGDEDKQKLTSLGLLEVYLDQTPIKPDEKPMAVEVMLEADLGKHGLPKLIGVLDLVRPNAVIVDFKTSSQSPNADNVAHLNEIQLTSYAILYRENTGDKESGQELHHLVKTKTPKLIVTQLPPITDNQQTRLFKQIESYVLGIQNEDYVPSPGIQCMSCQFLAECKSWH
jgi:CRISPR/Cas system-associated exonuclease Cas4 (RecB family)